MILSTNVLFKQVQNSSLIYNYRFSIKRRCDDITGSHKRRKEEQYNMPVCLGQKRHHQDSYDSQVGPKKPALQADSYGQSKPGMYNIIIIYYLH